MAAILASRPILRETVGAKLRRLARAARFNNPHVNGTMLAPPTVTGTGGAVDAALTRAYRIRSTTGLFRELGGVPADYFTDYRRYPVATLNAAGTGGNMGGGKLATGWQVEFMADAAKLSFRLQGSTAPFRFLVASDASGWRLQYVDLTGTVTSGASGTQYITLDFGSRALRKVVLEGEQAHAFDGVYVGPTETVTPTDGSDLLRAVFLTDSYGNTPIGGRINDAFPFVLGRALGIRDIRSSAVGSTGWLTGNSGYTIGQRVAVDLAPQNPDVAFIAAGTNDPNSAAAITAEVTTRVREFRALKQAVPLFVFGTWPQATGPDATKTAVENAVSAGVTAAADPLTIFVPVTTDPAGSWITGTGRVGATTGVGNSDFYTSGDGTHPPAAGHLYLGLRAADAVMAKLSLIA